MHNSPADRPNDNPSFTAHIWRSRLDILSFIIFLLTAGLYAFLILKSTLPLWGSILLAILCCLSWVLHRRLTRPTPFDPLLLILLCLLPLSLLISIDRPLSLSQVYGLLLSIAFLYTIVDLLHTRKWLYLSIVGLVVLAVGITFLGLFATDWSTTSIPYLSRLFIRIPRLFPSIPGAEFGEGIHVNTLGGVLVFFLPLLFSLIWDKGGAKQVLLGLPGSLRGLLFFYKLLLILVFLLCGVVLLVTASRGAFLGVSAGLIVLFILKDRRFLWVVPIILAVTVIIFLVFSGADFSRFIDLLDTDLDNSSLSARVQIWRDAVYLIQDFPLTGIGIGTFGHVFQDFYNFTIFPGTEPFLFHPHNTLLSIALDLGLPVLILYMALISAFFCMAWFAYKQADPLVKCLVIGLACGMLSHLVFGLTDAYPLGKKLGVVMWLYFGLMSALYVNGYAIKIKEAHLLSDKEDSPSQKLPVNVGSRLKFLLFGLMGWVVCSLLSLAFVNPYPLLALGLVVLGGIILGLVLTRRFNELVFSDRFAGRGLHQGSSTHMNIEEM